MTLCTCEGSKFHTGDRIVMADQLPTDLRTMLIDHATTRGIIVDKRLTPQTRAFIVGGTHREPSNEEEGAKAAGVDILRVADLQRMLSELCGENDNPGWVIDTVALARGSDRTSAVIPVAQRSSEPPDGLRRPRRALTRRPLTHDPLFWIVVLGWAGFGCWRAYHLDAIGFLSWLCAVFLVLGLAPALGRRMALTREDRKAFETQPRDLVPGWKSDPASVSIWRWWNGMSWTNALDPAARRWIGWLSIAVGVLLVSGWLVALDAGTSATPRPSGPGQAAMSIATPPADPGERIAVHLADLESGLLSYGSVKVEDLAASVVFASIDASYTAITEDLAEVATDAELAPGSPSLARLQQFATAMGPYIKSRRAFYSAQALCRAQPKGPGQTTCLAEASDAWEQSMLDTIPEVVTAYTELKKSP